MAMTMNHIMPTKQYLSRNKIFEYQDNKTKLSVCDNPTQIQAREAATKIDWVGSRSILIHQANSLSPNKSDVQWAFGVSKYSGSVTSIECSGIITVF